MPNTLTLSPPLFGVELEEFLKAEPVPLTPLIDQFLYQHTAMMIAADPKSGKSNVALQIACSLSSGTPLFGSLTIPAPQPVYYVAFETLPEEFQDQVWAMRNTVPLDASRFYWDDRLLGLNVLQETQADALIHRLAAYHPALVIFDPMYMMLRGGLSKDEPASEYVRFLRRLKGEVGCALLLLHHTHREHFTLEGQKIEEDNPFYGSQWLRAFVHTSYHLKKRDKEHSGVILHRRDDRTKSCLPTLTLRYDQETMSSSMEVTHPGGALGSLLAFLDGIPGQETDFYAALSVVKCSERHLRKLVQEPEVQRRLTVQRGTGRHRTVWRVK